MKKRRQKAVVSQSAQPQGVSPSTGFRRKRESLRSHWDSFWSEKGDIHEVYSNEERILRNLKAVVDLKGKKVLEIGAGTGRDSFPLAREGADVVQLDYSLPSLTILKRLSREQNIPATIVGGDTFALPFRDNTFDVVFHQGLLEHFRRPEAEKLLHENIRVLKPGGFLLVDVPQRYHPYTVVKRLLIASGVWFAGWERSFSIGELEKDMIRAGVRPVHRYGEWMVPSFFYRSTREGLRKIGVKLPLRPGSLPVAGSVRNRMRARLWRTKLPLYSGISIGVIGRKEITSSGRRS